MSVDLLNRLVRLDGRVVIVIGAGGGGIGTLITHLVASAGATVIAVDRSQEALDKHVAPLVAHGLPIRPKTADIMGEEGIAAVIACARETPGELYGLVTVVGASSDKYWAPSTRFSREGWDAMLSLNLNSMFFITQAVAAELKAQGKPGSLVSIASTSGLTANPYQIGYGVAKAGIVSVVKTMGLELAANGIRVNCVAPGAIGTPAAVIQPDKARDRKAVPMARQGRSEEIAGPVLFLLSPMSGYMTGQCLTVDGGASLKWSYLDEDNCPAYARHRDFLETRKD